MNSEEKLSVALERARKRLKEGIGTQSERLIHAALKYYLEPRESCHEVKIGRYTADIYQKETGHIFEIQTRGFERLRGKLGAFLPQHKVTVVFPVVHEKTLSWTDPETGEVSKSRKGPKKGSALEILPEIYRIPEYQLNPNLSFLVMLLNVEEFKLLDGWSRDRKRGAHRLERLPRQIAGAVTISGSEDYKALVPKELAESFTRAEFFRAVKMRERKGGYALTALERAGALEHYENQGRRYLYRRVL